MFGKVVITEEMIEQAHNDIATFGRINRTQASPYDMLVGNLGEYVYAQWRYGDWRRNLVGRNHGQSDFGDIEIKASAIPFTPTRLNLLVREDYAAKRRPRAYVQIIINVGQRGAQVAAGDIAFLCGVATPEDLDTAPTKDFGGVGGSPAGYRCRYIPVMRLRQMGEILDRQH